LLNHAKTGIAHENHDDVEQQLELLGLEDEHTGHSHGKINHNNQSRLTLLILNLAYMSENQQEGFNFDQDIGNGDVIFKKL